MIYRSGMKLLGAVLFVLCVAGCPNQSRNDSKTLLAQGNKEHGAKQFDMAITTYGKAVEKWSDNHLAYYGMGGSYAGRGEWDKASDAFSNAVRIAPEQPMSPTARTSSTDAMPAEAMIAPRSRRTRRS